jgi:hypothetical protein
MRSPPMPRRLLRLLWPGPLSLLVACARCEEPPPPPVRPSQPTLTVAPDPRAPTSGRRIVAVGQIAQPWRKAVWSPASITLSEVAAGDAIVVVGAYWGDLPARSSTAPTDDRGTLVRVLDQGPALVGRRKPPVFTQLYVELDPAPGAHTIIPPFLGGQGGDGTLYVMQIRGLTERRVVATGETWVKGAAIRELSVAIRGVVDRDDLLIALGGYDNTEQRERAGWSHPPPGWLALGVQEDAANNVPSELCHRLAPAWGTYAVTWTWEDPAVNVGTAVIAALR